jgi:hypothetical protein
LSREAVKGQSRLVNEAPPDFMDSVIKPLESERMSQYSNRYSKEFKEEAVRLLLTSGKTAEQLGRELGVTGQSLANWREEAIRNGDHPDQAKLDSVRGDC